MQITIISNRIEIYSNLPKHKKNISCEIVPSNILRSFKLLALRTHNTAPSLKAHEQGKHTNVEKCSKSKEKKTNNAIRGNRLRKELKHFGKVI